tara:strand:- start:192 stop:392 length:201 start_codon:yes stop_codon:yes gene_type:complete
LRRRSGGDHRVDPVVEVSVRGIFDRGRGDAFFFQPAAACDLRVFSTESTARGEWNRKAFHQSIAQP